MNALIALLTPYAASIGLRLAALALRLWPVLLATAGFGFDELTGGFAGLSLAGTVFFGYTTYRALRAETKSIVPTPAPSPAPSPSRVEPARIPILRRLLARIFNRTIP